MRLHGKPATAAGVNYYDALNRTGALPDTIAVTFFPAVAPQKRHFVRLKTVLI